MCNTHSQRHRHRQHPRLIVSLNCLGLVFAMVINGIIGSGIAMIVTTIATTTGLKNTRGIARAPGAAFHLSAATVKSPAWHRLRVVAYGCHFQFLTRAGGDWPSTIPAARSLLGKSSLWERRTNGGIREVTTVVISRATSRGPGCRTMVNVVRKTRARTRLGSSPRTIRSGNPRISSSSRRREPPSLSLRPIPSRKEFRQRSTMRASTMCGWRG